MNKLLLSLFTMLIGFSLFSATLSSFRIQQEKEFISPGEALPFKVIMTYPEDLRPAAWLAVVFESNVPGAFLDNLDLRKKLTKAKRPEWRYCTLMTKWFTPKLAEKEVKLELQTTTKWPKGDYVIKIQILLRKKSSPSTKTDKYIGRDLIFTIE